jgi:hypothetical protein
MVDSPNIVRPRHRQYFVSGSLCFLSFLFLYGITSRGRFQTSDEMAVFATGVSLATRGELAIDQLQALQEHVNVGQKGPDGHLYAKFFPGNALSAALVYKLTAQSNDQPYVRWFGELAPSATGARWCARLNAVWGALAMVALLLLLRRYFDWRTAILTVVLVGICSDWWYQSRGFFSEVGAGAFLVASLCCAAYNKPYGSSIALATSILFRPTNLFALPIWGKTVWRQYLTAFLSGLIIVAGGLILAGYNWVRFGSPLNFGYESGNFSAPLWQGLYGVLLSPGRSLFVYSPILLFAIPGGWLLYKSEKILMILCLIPVLGYAVTIAHWHRWDGGLTWGSRLMTPVVPLLAVLAAPALAYVWRNKWVGSAALLLGIIGLSVEVLALLRDPTRVVIEHVATGEIKYEDTLYTVHNSWLALQIRSLPDWQPCDLDADTLRHLWANCPQ